jgi:hypothetical protein
MNPVSRLLRSRRARRAKKNHSNRIGPPHLAFCRLVGEPLESRTLLSINWTGGGDGTSWNDKANWGGTLPAAADDVVIPAGFNVVHSTGTDTIHGLQSASALTISGGTLTVGTTASPGTVEVDNTFKLNGGTLSDADIKPGSGGQGLTLTTAGGTLDHVTADANLDLTQDFGISATITNGLTLNGTATFGSAAVHYGRFFFSGSQTLGGTGNVDFVTSANNSLFVNGVNTTLTIASTMTIHGQAGSIDGQGNALINNGKIAADVSGGTISIQASGGPFTNQGTVETDTGTTVQLFGPWTNTGTLNVNGGTLNLGGTFTTANLGTMVHTGGTVKLSGTLDNTGSTLTLNASTGAWQLYGGTIKGGIYESPTANQLILTTAGGTFDGLTVNSDLDLTRDFGVNVTIVHGLTLNATATLGSAAFHYGRIFFTGSQTLDGTGSVDFVTSGNNALFMTSDKATLTVAPTITIHGQAGSIDGETDSSLINQGKIAADVAGGTISIAPSGGPFTNQGTVETDTGATVQLFGPWSNAGTFNVNGGTLNLGGTFATADVGTMVHTGGTVRLSGTLDNTGSTFTLNSSTGAWQLYGGTIKGGVYESPVANQLILTAQGGTFDGLTVNSDLDLTRDFGVNVTIVHGLTLNATATLGSAAFHYGRIFFTGSQTLDGTGSVDFVTSGNNELLMTSANATLTIGPAMTIRGQTGSIDGQSNSSLINKGKIVTDVAGGTISIQPSGGPFTNQGTVETDTGLVQLFGPWSNTGTFKVNGGTLNLGGSFTTAGIGTMTRRGGTVNVSGTLDNTGSTLALDDETGSWRLLGGTIKGGIYVNSLGAELVFTTAGGTLDGLVANGDLDLTQDFGVSVNIVDGLTLNGTATFGSAAFHYAQMTFTGSQTLGGTGSIAFVTSGNDELFVSNASATLTIGPSITIHGQVGRIDGQPTTSIVNQGTITTEGASTGIGIAGDGVSLVNQGIVRAVRGGTLTVDASQLAIDGSSSLISTPSGKVAIQGSLLGNTQLATHFTPNGTLFFSGIGTAAAPQLLEAMSADLGAVSSAFNGNFALGKLVLQGGTYVKLVDQSDNAPGAGGEAVYVNSLTVPGGTTLDLNGLHLYARNATIQGTIVGGTVTTAPASSTLVWTGADAANNTNWSNPNNWSTHTTPVAGDTVVFDATAQNALATVDAAFAPGGPLADIQVTWGGEIAINSGFNLTAFNVEFGGGTLDGTGTLTVADNLTWSAGTMSGGGTTVVADTAGLLINDPTNVVLGNRTFNNFGAGVFSGARWDYGSGGVFNNEAGATFNMQSDANLNALGTSAFNNFGSFTKSVAVNTSRIGPAFNNTSKLDVQSGTLSLDGGGTSTGIFVAESGAALDFGGGTDDLSAASTQIYGGGTLGFTGATVTIGGGYAVTGTTSISAGEVDFNDAATSTTVVQSGGTLGGSATFTANGSFEWSGGTMAGSGTTVIPFGAALTIDDQGDVTLSRTLSNFGPAVFSGARWDFSGGVFNNESGASFALQSDADFNALSASTFNNMGSFVKSPGTGTAHIQPTFNNSGTVDVKTGTLSLDGGGTSSGSFTAESGATLDFGGGTHDLSAAGSSIGGAGNVGFTGATVTIGGMYAVTGTTSISSGEADFNHDATANAVVVSGGALGGSATFTANGSFEWSGGTMLGGGTTVIPAGVILTIDDTVDITLVNRTLDDSGSAIFTGVRWDFGSGGVFNNVSGATFDVQSDATFNALGTSAFNNAGTFTKSIGTGATHVQPAFNNSGSVDVKSGTLSLDGGGTSTGAFTSEGGASLDFGGGTHDLSSPTSSISGAGTVGFTGANVTIGGSYAVMGTTSISSGEADFNHDATSAAAIQSGGTLGGSATFTANGSFEWSGGAMLGGGTTVIPAGVTLTIDDAANATLSRKVNNSGSAVFSGARWDFDGGVFTNESGASFALKSDADFNALSASTFNNAGTFTKSPGTGTTHVRPGFNNSGTVDVKSGTLSLDGGGTSTGGFKAENGATLEFGGGTHDLSAASSSVTDAGTVGFAGATVTLGGTYAVTGTTLITAGKADFNHDATARTVVLNGGTLGGSATFTANGSFEWSGGTMLGGGTTVIPAGVTLTIDDPTNAILSRALNNSGLTVFTGARWDFDGGVFTNEAGASFAIESDADFNALSASTFSNSGTFTKSPGSGTTHIQPAFKNGGTVDVKTGILAFDGAFTQTAGATILDGGAIQNASSLMIQGGSLSGSGTLTGDVDNSGGTVSPGFSPGVINITGNYTQSASGTLSVEIGGASAGTDFDVLNIGGTARLAGTLAVSLISSFLPAVGSSFQIMTFAAKNGQFAQYMGLDSGNNRLFGPAYAATNLALTAGLELTATGAPIVSLIGRQFTGVVATVTDADTSDTVADLTATIDWGDNSSSTGTVSSDGQGGFNVSGTHTYSDVPSGLPVSITVSDGGGSTVVTQTTADIGATLIAVGRTFAATEGASFSGTVAAAVDPGVAPGDLSATIDWGDGTTEAGTVAAAGNGFVVTGSHTYAEEGTKPVDVVVKNQQQNVSTAHSTATIADASLSATGTTIETTEGTTFSGTVATFTDANANAPPGDYTTQIVWGDGATTAGTVTTSAGGGLAVTGSHVYAEESTQTVSVVISDIGGASATATTTATIDDAPLSATGAAISTTEGATFSGTVATFTDANLNAPMSDYAAQVVWGDGTTTAATVTTRAGGGLVVNGTHVYAEEGTQTVKVTISDRGGATAMATTTAVIDDAPLSATGTTITATEGATFSGTVATFTDADLNAPLSDYTAHITWGDGITTTGTVTTNPNLGLVVTGSLVYAEEGTRTVSVTITDIGGETATATTTATIDDAPLSATGTTITATEGATFSGTVATFTDANSNAPLSDYTVQITWGDGVTGAGTVTTTVGGGLAVKGRHVYAEEGTRTVSVTISDIGGATATATTTATIDDAPLSATGGTIAATAGTTFSGTVATFTDGDPAGAIADFVATINWGDGSSSTGTVSAASGAFAVSGTHSYASTGNFPLAVTIRDTGGSHIDTTGTAEVSGVVGETLNGVGLAVSGFELSPLTNGPVATFTSSNPQPVSAFTVTIHWGDGTSSAGVVTLSNNQYTVVGSHTYGEEGNYTVGIEISDRLASTTVVATAKIQEELLFDGTAGTADQRFVNEVYRDLLGRKADPQGLAFWVGHLQEGRTNVVQAILATEEYHADLIQAEFERFLHRAAEAKAVDDFSAMLDAGGDTTTLDMIIVSSPEYFALHGGTNDEFLNGLFASALGRGVDPGSRPFYDGLLANSASRAAIADVVFTSDEYHHDLVERWFERYLDRPADPTGLAALAAQLDAGTPNERVIAVILASDEYLARIS